MAPKSKRWYLSNHQEFSSSFCLLWARPKWTWNRPSTCLPWPPGSAWQALQSQSRMLAVTCRSVVGVFYLFVCCLIVWSISRELGQRPNEMGRTGWSTAARSTSPTGEILTWFWSWSMDFLQNRWLTDCCIVVARTKFDVKVKFKKWKWFASPFLVKSFQRTFRFGTKGGYCS